MPQFSAEKHKLVYSIFLGIGLFVILPFLTLTLYNHPQADDYGFAVRDMQYGFWETHKTYYLNWTGRYFSTNTAFRINPLIAGPFELIGVLPVYRLYSLLLILLLVASIWLLLHFLLRYHIGRVKVAALTALLLSLYILQMPSVSEGIFWLSGYLTYQLPNVMMLLLLALLNVFFRTEKGDLKSFYIAIATLLCVAVVGSNEMSLVMAFTTILLLLIENRKDKRNRPYLLFLFAICVAACLAAVLAPGNYARMGDHPDAAKPLWSVIYAAFLTGMSFYRWLAPVLLATLLYAIYWGLPLADKAKSNRIFNIDLRCSLFYYLATIFLMQFAFTWAVGERPTPRVENVIYFFFVLGWFYNVQVAITRFRHHLTSERTLNPALPAAIFCLFLLSLSDVNSTVATAYVDLLSGKAAAYDEALHTRYADLQNSGCDTCLLDPLPAIPQSLYFMDAMEGKENSAFWVNDGLADYWGKSAVYLNAPNPEVKDNLETLRDTGKDFIKQRL